MVLITFNIFPNGCRCYAKHLITFFLSEIFKYIFFRTISTVCSKVISWFTNFFGKFCFQLGLCFTRCNSIFHTIKCRDKNQCQCSICICIRVWRTQFVTCSHRIIDISNQTTKDCTVTTRFGRIST